MHDKVDNAVKITCDKVEKSYADAIAVNPKAAEAGTSGAKNESKTQDHDIRKSCRLQGVKESRKTKSVNLVPTTDMVQEVLNTIGVKSQIQELRRLEKFDKRRNTPRTFLLTLATDHNARVAVAKSIENRENLAKRNLYILPALTKEEATNENVCLKRRLIEELIEEGVPRKKLKIHNFELFNDGKKIENQASAGCTST